MTKFRGKNPFGNTVYILLNLQDNCLEVERQKSNRLIVHGISEEKNVRERLDALWDEKEFFALKKVLDQSPTYQDDSDRLFYNALIEGVFNNPNLSEELLHEYLAKYGGRDKERDCDILKTHAENMLRTFQYQPAATAYKRLLDLIPDDDRSARDDVENSARLVQAIALMGPQQVIRPERYEVAYHLNRFGHMMVEAQCCDVRGEFLFDTGANFSSISQSFALKSGLTVMDTGIEVVTATGARVRSRVAMAARFTIGEAQFSDVVMLVFDDAELDFPEFNYRIDAIVGIPVLSQMGKMRIGEGKIAVDQWQTLPHTNMCFDSFIPVVEARSAGEQLLFTFDTGANRSELSYRYLERHRDRILREASEVSSHRGGGGGVVIAPGYELSNFELETGGSKTVMDTMAVSQTQYLFNEDKDGNLGQDLLSRFRYTYLDFESMNFRLTEPIDMLPIQNFPEVEL